MWSKKLYSISIINHFVKLLVTAWICLLEYLEIKSSIIFVNYNVHTISPPFWSTVIPNLETYRLLKTCRLL